MAVSYWEQLIYEQVLNLFGDPLLLGFFVIGFFTALAAWSKIGFEGMVLVIVPVFFLVATGLAGFDTAMFIMLVALGLIAAIFIMKVFKK